MGLFKKGRHAGGIAAKSSASSKKPTGGNLNFIAAEAYKLLRTNLMFSFSDEEQSHIIGITSSLRGEGKSTTAINLAYSLADAGKRVLLLEGDMRIPSFGKALRIHTMPGLSNILAGMINQLDEVIQTADDQPNLDIMSAGDPPPNPSELLGSARMKNLLQTLQKIYEYIIIDLPPVSVVSDPLVISKYVHGMIVVVRHNYVDSRVLNEVVRQLRFANVRILGFVYNLSTETAGVYSKKYSKEYNKKYGKKYGRYGEYVK